MFISASLWGYMPRYVVANELTSGKLTALNLEVINFKANGKFCISKLANH